LFLGGIVIVVSHYAMDISSFVSENRILEKHLIEQTRKNISEISRLRNLLIYQSRKGHASGPDRRIPGVIDSLSNIRYQSIISVEEQLVRMHHCVIGHVTYKGSRALPSFEQDLIPFRRKWDQFQYYKSALLMKWMMYFIESTATYSCGLSRWYSHEIYDPTKEEYELVIGSYDDRGLSEIWINGLHTPDGRFKFAPTHSGIHTLEILMPAYDPHRNQIVYDTSYYRINVVGENPAEIIEYAFPPHEPINNHRS
jgi:hypothetical protein